MGCVGWSGYGCARGPIVIQSRALLSRGPVHRCGSHSRWRTYKRRCACAVSAATATAEGASSRPASAHLLWVQLSAMLKNAVTYRGTIASAYCYLRMRPTSSHVQRTNTMAAFDAQELAALHNGLEH